MMKTYQGLRGLCTMWLILAIITGVILIAIGIVGATGRAGDSISYIIGGLVLIPIAFTVEQIISLFIDMALSLQRIADSPEPKEIPQLGIRRKPKE